MVGSPPRSDSEPAWCRDCGSLWSELPFGLGWAWSHPLVDHDAPTIANIVRNVASDRSLEAELAKHSRWDIRLQDGGGWWALREYDKHVGTGPTLLDAARKANAYPEHSN